MLLGWFRKRREAELDRQELEDLRQLVEEMGQVLENVDMLLAMDEREMEITSAMLWQAEYFKPGVQNAWKEMRVPLFKQRVPMPEPDIRTETLQLLEHRSIRLNWNVTMSDHELLLRRTPAEYAELARRVSREMERRVLESIASCVDPVARARALQAGRIF